MLKWCRNIFRHFWQCSEVFGKSSEIFRSHWDIFGNPWVMKRWQSQAFDSEKVGRYSIAAMSMYCMSVYLYWPLCVLFRFVELKLWISLIGFGGGLLVLITTGILKRAENLGSNFMRWVAIVADDTVNWNSKEQEPVTRRVWIQLNLSTMATLGTEESGHCKRWSL